MAFETLLKTVNDVSVDADYWFVRTDNGENFETFYTNKFIGIGWNEITLDDLKTKTIEDVKAKILKYNKIDISKPKGKSKVTAVYNKLKRFTELKQGDRVIIPSKNSEEYAFGIISESMAYNDIKQSGDCDYIKRHRVRWVHRQSLRSLDPMFYKIRMSRHSISSVKEYAPYIDKTMGRLYYKGDSTHFILDVRQPKDVSQESLIRLIGSIKQLTQDANEQFLLNEDISLSFIRINLQSPGNIEFILRNGKALVIAASAIAFSCGSDKDAISLPRKEQQQMEQFIELNDPILKDIKAQMDTLRVAQENINKR